MLQCRKCKSGAIHRSHTRTTWENLRKQCTAKRLFRCRACGWRGWGDDFGMPFNSGELDADARPKRAAVDLSELDNLHARQRSQHHEEPD